MQSKIICAGTFLLASFAYLPALRAQATPAANQLAALSQPRYDALPSAVMNPHPQVPSGLAPFSRFALAGGLSPLGIEYQAAVNVNRFMNVRGTGSMFNYSLSNLSVSGFNVSGKLNLASAGGLLDVFPWPNHGFRLSAGALFYNQNSATATVQATGGTSFTLNDTTYYSSSSDPVAGAAGVSLHARNPAPMFTIGWGNLISRRGGHWSVPFEMGAAMIGDPLPTLAFTGGQVCSDPQGTQNCQDVVGNSSLNSNLQAQLVKYQSDLQPLRFYPIISVGVGYNFPIRHSPGPASF